MRSLDLQRIHQALEGASVEFRARTGANHRVALAPAGTVHQDDAVVGIDQGLDIAIEIRPAARPRPRSVQHDDGFGAGANLVVMELQVELAFQDADQAAAFGFGRECHGNDPFCTINFSG
ncbi:hypothetical protein SDC9_199137 [bioreactor metagenome]|uniref:Uncharacterized protein n=1 Tax=bioreactor metagenome TaxID=1076179 RepID=A0A645ILZ9_9ZZZZ